MEDDREFYRNYVAGFRKRSKHKSEKIERLTLAKAITRGLEDAMEADRTVVMLGEDIGSSAACTV